MTKKEIIEGNRLIAEFMGYEKSKFANLPNKVYKNNYTEGISVSQLQYNSSWDWLMPVLEKIETIKQNGYLIDVIIYKSTCHINNIEAILIESTGKNRIEATWKAVVEFIKWYSQQ